MKPESPAGGGNLKVLDYFQLVTSFLFLTLGVLILVRSASSVTTPIILIVGGGFILLGVYRLFKFYQYFRQAGR